MRALPPTGACPALHRLRTLVPALVASLVLTGCQPMAPTPATEDAAALAGPPDRIERMAAACNGCHGPDGRGSGAIPPLAGRDATLLAARLAAWRAATEADGADHVMVRFAHALEPSDVRPLADHYAALAAPAAPQP